ncbi:MAG TPA: EAL domain-containing protein, partial [Rhodocyclaceae bacterium]|nr:EAL domain-containing protein [Rhodocyclaceae bacterium]
KTDYVVEKRCRRKDGSQVWVRITSSLLHDAGLAHCISIVEDISKRQQAEAALLQSEERLRYVTDAAGVGSWDWDIATDRLEWSDRCKAIFGVAQDEPLSYQRFMDTIGPEEQGRVAAAVQRALEGEGDYELEFPVIWPCGTGHWVHAKGRVAFDAIGKPLRMAGIVIDITARKSMEDAVRRLSLHDVLTGLPNRSLIYEYGDHMLSQAQRGDGRVAFIFVDLDHFKPINDNYGHDAGDAVLKEVARRLSDCVRGEDFVGRLGGDEFLAVLSHINNADNAARVALQVLKKLDQPISFGELSLQVSPSIGLAVSPEDGNTVDELIKNADTAMYHAKVIGRNNYQFFRPEMNERAEQARVLAHELRLALERGEFQLHFQPVVQLADGLPRAAEALLRWPGAEVGPELFIPAAESAGLMPALGNWVLREVCRQQRHWLNRGLPLLPVAVNISSLQLNDEHLPEHIRGATNASGLPWGGLSVELTEQSVTGHGAAANRVLADLHRMGVKVAVNDFGAGTSSINELGHMQLDSLKLDRSFVRAIGHDPAAVPVIDAILALARSLNLDVVAEGIESEEVLQFLRERNCPLGQGFFFTQPLPGREFEDWYRESLAA